MSDNFKKIASLGEKGGKLKELIESYEKLGSCSEEEMSQILELVGKVKIRQKKAAYKLIGSERCAELEEKYGDSIFQYIACADEHTKDKNKISSFMTTNSRLLEDANVLFKEFGLKISVFEPAMD